MARGFTTIRHRAETVIANESRGYHGFSTAQDERVEVYVWRHCTVKTELLVLSDRYRLLFVDNNIPNYYGLRITELHGFIQRNIVPHPEQFVLFSMTGAFMKS